MVSNPSSPFTLEAVDEIGAEERGALIRHLQNFRVLRRKE